MKRIFKSSLVLLVFAVAATSCKKDNNASSPLALNNTKASVPNRVTGVINGHWGNPRTPATFGSIYINPASSTIDTASTLTASHVIALTSYNNTFVQGVNGYTLQYVQGTSYTFATIGLATIGTASASIGQSTATTSPYNGWYTYTPPGAGYAVTPDFYVIAKKTGSPSYAFKFTSIVGEGSATSNRAVFGIEYGAIQ